LETRERLVQPDQPEPLGRPALQARKALWEQPVNRDRQGLLEQPEPLVTKEQ
jgi:hypothetical protein